MDLNFTGLEKAVNQEQEENQPAGPQKRKTLVVDPRISVEEGDAKLGFRVGTAGSRSFVLRNLSQFVRAYQAEETFQLTKKESVDFAVQDFTDDSMPLVEFMILARVARPMTKTHLIMLIALVAGFFYAIIFHNELFGISNMTWQTMLLLIVFLIATQAVFRYFYRFTTFVGKLITKEGRDELRKRNDGKLIKINLAPDENKKRK